jgi:hypothetical protein
MTTSISRDHLEALAALASACTRMVESEFLMARVTVRDGDVSGTHLYSRNPRQPLSLCGHLVRNCYVLRAPSIHRADFAEVTCLACLDKVRQAIEEVERSWRSR